jgi:glycosyltransferase involved in cell wall biosynthesis
MPVNNHGAYLQRTLASIAEQRGVDIELVAVDDGSADDSAAIVEAFARDAAFPVTLVRQANAGAHAALNRGIALASAPTIALINSDDVYAPGRLARMLRTLDETGALLAISDAEFIDDDDRPFPDHAPRTARLRAQIDRFTRDDPLRVLVQVNIAVSTGNFVMRRALLERIGGFADLSICHDWDFLLSATYATPIAFVPERLYGYRLHADNTLGAARLQGQFEGEIVLSRFLAKILEHPRLAEPAAMQSFIDYARSVGLATFLPSP